MSTLAYAALTTQRDEATPGKSTSTEAPGVGRYVDAFAALVPAEVLTLHGVMVTAATTVNGTKTTIDAPAVTPFFWAYVVLILLSIVLYAVPRIRDKKWDRLDWIRAAIPPLAFVGWTMLQRATAFDAAVAFFQGSNNQYWRTFIAVILAALLAFLASSLAYQADQKSPAPAPAPK